MGRGGKGGGCPVLECVGKGISYIINTRDVQCWMCKEKGKEGLSNFGRARITCLFVWSLDNPHLLNITQDHIEQNHC